MTSHILKPDSIVESPIVRALRGEPQPLCILTESEALEGRGKVIFGEKTKELQGKRIPIRVDGLVVGTAALDIRADGIYINDITPTKYGAEWAKDPKITAHHGFASPKVKQ